MVYDYGLSELHEAPGACLEVSAPSTTCLLEMADLWIYPFNLDQGHPVVATVIAVNTIGPSS